MSTICSLFSDWHWVKAAHLFGSARPQQEFCTLDMSCRQQVLTLADCYSQGHGSGCWAPGACMRMCSFVHLFIHHDSFIQKISITYLLGIQHSSQHLGYISEQNCRKPLLWCSLHCCYRPQTINTVSKKLYGIAGSRQSPGITGRG